jgi:hypothetical protein
MLPLIAWWMIDDGICAARNVLISTIGMVPD